MTQSSQRIEANARKNHALILQGLKNRTNNGVAADTGWDISKTSRFFGEKRGKLDVTDAEAVSKMLAEMGLTLHPSHHRITDPGRVDVLLEFAQIGAKTMTPQDFFQEPIN